VFLILFIIFSGGTSLYLFGVQFSARQVQNPLTLMWLLGLAWVLTKWRWRIRLQRPDGDAFWRATQALTITTAVFAVLSLPLIVQAFARGVGTLRARYFWRSAPRGVDVLAPDG
jgi:hypothetical protein